MEQDDAVFAALLMALALFTSFVLGHMINTARIRNVPQSAAAILSGVCLAVILRLSRFTTAQARSSSIFAFNPQVFYLFMLPPIILEAGFSLNRPSFTKNIVPILFYALIGTLICALITFATIYPLASYVGFEGSDREIVTACLMFATLIAAVDPVATLSILGGTRFEADETLFSIVFGESILNDAVAVVLFRTTGSVLLSEDSQGQFPLSGLIGWVSYDFVKVTLISGIVGCGIAVTAFIAFRLSSGLKKFPEYELGLLLLLSYLSFATAEVFCGSGILALFVLSVLLGRYSLRNLSPSSQRSSALLFKVLAVMSETFIYIIFGITATDVVLEQRFSAAKLALCTLVAIMAARAVTVFPSAAVFNRLREWKESKLLETERQARQSLKDFVSHHRHAYATYAASITTPWARTACTILPHHNAGFANTGYPNTGYTNTGYPNTGYTNTTTHSSTHLGPHQAHYNAHHFDPSKLEPLQEKPSRMNTAISLDANASLGKLTPRPVGSFNDYEGHCSDLHNSKGRGEALDSRENGMREALPMPVSVQPCETTATEQRCGEPLVGEGSPSPGMRSTMGGSPTARSPVVVHTRFVLERPNGEKDEEFEVITLEEESFYTRTSTLQGHNVPNVRPHAHSGAQVSHAPLPTPSSHPRVWLNLESERFAPESCDSPYLSSACQILLWLSGLRGSIAFVLALSLPFHGHNATLIREATLMLVILTTFLLGCCVELFALKTGIIRHTMAHGASFVESPHPQFSHTNRTSLITSRQHSHDHELPHTHTAHSHLQSQPHLHLQTASYTTLHPPHNPNPHHSSTNYPNRQQLPLPKHMPASHLPSVPYAPSLHHFQSPNPVVRAPSIDDTGDYDRSAAQPEIDTSMLEPAVPPSTGESARKRDDESVAG